MCPLCARRGQLGLTLIELMVSIAIGLVVVGAVTYMYIGSKGAYRGNEALARVQDAGRFALDSIARDLRRAGALGCGSFASVAGQGAAVNVNVIAPNGTGINPAVLTVTGSSQPIPIAGFEPASYALPATAPTGWVAPTGAAPYWGGDILQLQIASGAPVRVTGLDTTAGTITIADNTAPNGGGAGNFNAGDYAVVANCSAATVFKVVSSSATSGASALAYASGTIPPLTATGQFSLATDTYPTVQHYDQVTYYIGQVPNSTSPAFPNGLPALYRYSLGSGKAEELVENVEDLDVVYGIGTNGAINAYKKTNTPMTAADFSNVISVRISLVAVGDQMGAAPASQTLAFHGTDAAPMAPTAWTAPDTRLRQVFSATSALRSRLQ